VARATVGDTVRAALTMLAPMLAQGVIVRRPAMLGLAEKFDTDGRVGRLLSDLRVRYGSRSAEAAGTGPLRDPRAVH
jgi:hypothetical protein